VALSTEKFDRRHAHGTSRNLNRQLQLRGTRRALGVSRAGVRVGQRDRGVGRGLTLTADAEGLAMTKRQLQEFSPARPRVTYIGTLTRSRFVR
jgi:hypothetical protein